MIVHSTKLSCTQHVLPGQGKRAVAPCRELSQCGIGHIEASTLSLWISMASYIRNCSSILLRINYYSAVGNPPCHQGVCGADTTWNPWNQRGFRGARAHWLPDRIWRTQEEVWHRFTACMFTSTLVDWRQRETALRLPLQTGSGSSYPQLAKWIYLCSYQY